MISGLIVLCSSSIGLYVLARDLYSEREIRQLILSAYNDHRPGDGRLWGTPYVPLKAISEPQPDLGRAQVFLLRHPDIEDRQRLQGMVYIATGEWRAYVESSRTPDAERDASTLNDLGVVFLALSDSDPTYLLRALDQFERAAQLDTTAEEPRFNLVITYRRLRLQRLANESLSAYCTLDSDSPWCDELSASNEVDESAAVAQLRQFTTSGDSTQAKKTFERDPELFRRLVMQYGLSNVPESPTLVRFIGQEIEERFNDRSISAMLSPLFTDRREIVLAVRNLVTEGAELYVKGDLQGSLEAYKKAEDLVERTGSIFDRLWIDINRVDTWIRAGEFDEARESLRQAIAVAVEYKFLWLQAKALSIYGSTLRLTSGYAEMLDLLAKADRQFVAIGASNDRVRPLTISPATNTEPAIRLKP